MPPVHPLHNISAAEIQQARDVVLANHSKAVIDFREIFIQEPAKADLVRFLDLEHRGQLSPTSERPSRLAKCQYDVIGADKVPYYHEAIVDVGTGKVIKHEVVGSQHQASLTLYVASQYPGAFGFVAANTR